MKAMKRGSRWTQLLQGTSRWGAVALAAFYLNFVAVHLATEMHFHGEDHSHAGEADHGHDDDHGHTPHDASDHLLDVVLKGADPILAGPALATVLETFILEVPARFTWTQPVFERERPPGESPPDPQQPRAPPLG
jgi:hypothetical protein